jgi:hypothetical protein
MPSGLTIFFFVVVLFYHINTFVQKTARDLDPKMNTEAVITASCLLLDTCWSTLMTPGSSNTTQDVADTIVEPFSPKRNRNESPPPFLTYWSSPASQSSLQMDENIFRLFNDDPRGNSTWELKDN